MPSSRLTLINDELLLTGETPFNEPDDGTDAWNVCSAAYDAGVERLLGAHDWKFATDIRTLAAPEEASPDPAYTNSYARPSDTLQLVWVRNSVGTDEDYRILGGRILTNTEDELLVKIVVEPSVADMPALFKATLRKFMRAGIYRGLKKDAQTARGEERDGEVMLGQARTRTDQEEQPRSRFKGTLRTVRSVRRGG